jgi:hypothetical protein
LSSHRRGSSIETIINCSIFRKFGSANTASRLCNYIQNHKIYLADLPFIKICASFFSTALIWNILRQKDVGRDSSVGIATRYMSGGMGIKSRCEARFFALFHTGTVTRPAACTMGSGYLCRVKGRGVALTTQPPLIPRLKKL